MKRARSKRWLWLFGPHLYPQSFRDDYPMLRINRMPEVEVHIVSSTEAPSGIGEPGVLPIAAAVTNAIFAATGRRIRRLPIGTVGKKMCKGGDVMVERI